MYPKRRLVKDSIFVNVDDLDVYDEETIRKQVEEGVLNPGEAGFLKGVRECYEEEEED